MIRLRIISLFLALLMTIQMVPVASIGALIGSNQWNEELPHGMNEAGKGEIVMNSFLIPESFLSIDGFNETKSLIYIHFSESIPANHSNDVLTPPPDLSA